MRAESLPVPHSNPSNPQNLRSRTVHTEFIYGGAATDQLLFLFPNEKQNQDASFHPERHHPLSCLMPGFCSHALHPPGLCSSCMTDDDSTLALIPAIYTFRNNWGCHKRRQMVVFSGFKQKRCREGCRPPSEHGKIHGNLTKKKNSG